MTKNTKAWLLGLLILVLFIVLGELSLVFGEYVFYRLGFDRNSLLLALWVMPVVASFVAAYYSESYKFLWGMSYILVLPILGSIAHYINAELGSVVDFTGYSGAVEIFKIYLAVGSVIVTVGTFLGVYFSRNRQIEM